MRRAVRFTDQDVTDVLVPRDRLRTLPSGHTVGQFEQTVIETGFSRFPVEDEAGSLLGYVHAKDLLHLGDEPPEAVYPRQQVRPLPAVESDASLDQVVQELREAGAHLAAVVDADGGIAGVVMLEDALEALVGAVRDRTHAGRR